jgi:putative ABC transport system ATP-binding protein
MVAAHPPLYRFEEVSVRFGDIRALDGVSFEVKDGLVTVITGPSGAGKSTLLRLCNRLEVPGSGVVRFRDEDVVSMDPLTLCRRVGMVFQRPTLFGGTVRETSR